MQPTTEEERRSRVRIEMTRDVTYRVTGAASVTGCGRTINISSHGVLFTTDAELNAGDRVELAVDWPLRLGGRQPLRLILRGEVVRTQTGAAAMRIRTHEFRTAGLPREVRSSGSTGHARSPHP